MPPEPYWLPTTDYHTAGEPFRIVKDIPPGHLTDGLTVSQQRLAILSAPSHPLDLLRRTLCHEPRGHADMYGCFITPPDDSGAHLGCLFWHKDGFSTACGHGTIALGYWAVAEGIAKRDSPSSESLDVVIDVPSGRVVARVAFDGAREVRHVDFINVASHQISAGHSLTLTSSPNELPVTVQVDLSFAGAVYASINTTPLNLPIQPSNSQTFISLARQIKASFPNFLYKDRYDLYGVCFFEHVSQTPEAVT